MKQNRYGNPERLRLPAAFRRLCVETKANGQPKKLFKPAAFRRLCVETKQPS